MVQRVSTHTHEGENKVAVDLAAGDMFEFRMGASDPAYLNKVYIKIHKVAPFVETTPAPTPAPTPAEEE